MLLSSCGVADRLRWTFCVANYGHASVKMVTSNKLPDKKVVTMAEQNNRVVVPQRTLLGDINVHITCPICRGYYIDATTIVECLHSFCRSCIIKHLQVNRNNSYCPVCEMMINSSKPNIKPDKALQDIVYKLVPGLFQKEMERRQKFYASRPGPAASATPEQRGEDTERIIFSPEDVISFSLEYADATTDNDSISSKSSDSNESQLSSNIARRYLQCPAVVNISHLKKFICMKYDIDSTQFSIDILYKRVPLPDYYTLMDIAYIYNWKRNEPMRFFYQIIDYVAIRNRLFDINRKGSHFQNRKPNPSFDDVSRSAPNLNDQGSEASSGTDSPMPDDSSKQVDKKIDKCEQVTKSTSEQDVIVNTKTVSSPSNKKNEEDVEKSQFLNSFELTAKNTTPTKSSPSKTESQTDGVSNMTEATAKDPSATNTDDSLKRKHEKSPNSPEIKKFKVELEKTKIPDLTSNSTTSTNTSPSPKSSIVNSKNTESIAASGKSTELITPQSHNSHSSGKTKEYSNFKHSTVPSSTSKVLAPVLTPMKDIKPQVASPGKQIPLPDSPGIKRPVTVPHSTSPKRRPIEATTSTTPAQPPMTQKPITPLKLQMPKLQEAQSTSPSASNIGSKLTEVPKPTVKKIPDLKPGIVSSLPPQNKTQPVNKVRMDLLANNCDPTMDRSKILSQVKVHNSGQPSSSGDPLKSLFDSCKINIPSSLSITLTDQKLDPRNPVEPTTTDLKKNLVNKNLASANSGNTHKVPSPPVHNYIEILKLPDTDPKKQTKPENVGDTRAATPNRGDGLPNQPKPTPKSFESSAKGPIPNLKPIADTKLGKSTGNYASPITFQQTFEKQLQSLQSDNKKSKLPTAKGQVPKLMPATPKAFGAVSKLGSSSSKPGPSAPASNPESKPSTALDLSSPQPKLPKSKGQVPKLVPATPKSFSTVNKPGSSVSKPNQNAPMSNPENKPSTALDLTTPHNIPSQLSPHLTKALETMQSIANLAKTFRIPGPTGWPH